MTKYATFGERATLFTYKPDGETGCWLWMGSRDRWGYGLFFENGKMRRAHRASYEYYIGPLGSLMACHHCDTPPCISPFHLFAGTALDNARDMVEKGRGNGPKGERNSQAVLTDEKVRRLVELYNEGELFVSQIADLLDMTEATAQKILYSGAWSHITGKNFKRRRRSVLTDTQAETVYHDFCNDRRGRSIRQFAKDYNMNDRALGALLTGVSYKHLGFTPLSLDGPHTRCRSFSDGVALDIYRRYKEEGATQTGLAKEYSVDVPVVNLLLRGKTYRHLGLAPLKGDRSRGGILLESA